MQAPSILSNPYHHSENPSEHQKCDLKSVLMKVLDRERKSSPLPKASLTLGSGPLLILIDGDTLSDHQITKLIKALLSQEPQTYCVVSANRDLERVNLQLDLSSLTPQQVELKSVELTKNAADQALSLRAEELMNQRDWSALLIFTQDNDLFVIAQRWRRARRPSFMIMLRTDEAGNALLKRGERLGLSVLSLNQSMILGQP